MSRTVLSGVAAICPKRACRSLAKFLILLGALAFLFAGARSMAQDSQAQGVLPAPSSGEAIVCIYRTYRFTGSTSHDEIYVNGKHLGKLLSNEYEFAEVEPGTVVISGFPKEYYGSVVMSAMAAANQARQKEHERARFAAEAGKTYFFKWTAGAAATGIKVTPEDSDKGAKDILKLHLSKPPDDKEEAKPPVKAEDQKPPAN